MVVAKPKKKNLNIYIAEEVAVAFDKERERLGLHERQKGLGLASAMLMFMEAETMAKKHYLNLVASANAGGSFAELVEQAKNLSASRMRIHGVITAEELARQPKEAAEAHKDSRAAMNRKGKHGT